MKHKLALVIGCLVFAIAAIAVTVTQTVDMKIDNTVNSPAITIQKPGATLLTSNVFEYFGGSTLKAKIKPDGTFWSVAPAAQRANIGIDTGSGVISADGTVTNTFAATFAAAPKVFLTTWTNGTAVIVGAVTTTNFVVGGVVGTNVNWLAIGQ